jgi:hypothetical protein
MIPAVEQMLLTSAGLLGQDIAPRVASEAYALGNVGTTALMLVFAVQEIDRAAENHARDIDERRAIFAQAATVIDDAALAARLAAAAGSAAPRSMRPSVLGAENATLAELLIALHALVEERDTDWARRIERAILDHLAASAGRRTLFIPPSG